MQERLQPFRSQRIPVVRASTALLLHRSASRDVSFVVHPGVRKRRDEGHQLKEMS